MAVDPVALEAPSARPARTPRPRERAARRSSQRALTGAVIWIVLVAGLLAGVVAMNVAVLRLNVRIDELGRQRASLHAENAALESRLSSAAAAARIERLARRQGLGPADPKAALYLDLTPRTK